MSDPRADLGPSLPPRCSVYQLAAELNALSRLAMEFSLAGARCDLPRAMKKLDEARALLGEGDA